ncbi:bladder cancer-associated protein-like [Paramacrobiotus metropolitanus]|uniref:bladder cancer-associated protein-like n=1 Tax=Paramacrobiotus metropolitanus TaxID=2943436 RepID=UPI0024462803|nr:bladder cancer-associated protein-like [Paramacrobiotus metropolitanus]XP_055354065.1 bladder cancer-associated protein-like [Paramacrobiotus metropolitanus]XP_055354067.1 bladder cancer-associated protein-like [Paramacrobiotus metropolitanus]XP_055354068.1 bladder cancer-associated protein-like [Paramacrobiotus metropolitanus]XP_055354069.1 bladder cancer-associated protein-like [Paramacrobiotus metropolitanus]XP_055354070.1 bladder cancer-associated protein-like [Paramacrobiotus metropoli
MYCLQWLLPLLLVPKPALPYLLAQVQYTAFFSLYVLGFILKRKPCILCTAVFLLTCLLVCWSGLGHCIFWIADDQDDQTTCRPAHPNHPHTLPLAMQL